jgi:glycosyltransferase involved in cell wall biosynthesis
MKKIKVVWVAAHFAPHIGGIEKYSETVVSMLSQRGFDCIILTNNTEKVETYTKINGVDVYRLNCLNLIKKQFPITLPSLKNLKVLFKIKKCNPDVVVTNTRYFNIHLFAQYFLAGKRMHIEHGSDFVELKNPVLNLLGKIFDKVIGGLVIKNSNYCAGVSGDVNEFVNKYFKKKIDNIFYNSVDINNKLPIDQNWKEKFKIPKSTIVFGFAGRLIEEKGILYVTNSFLELKNKHNNREFILLIGGKGPLKEKIEGFSNKFKEIHFLGAIDPKEMGYFYNTINIFLSPTYYREGFPTVLLEAGLYGKLIITTPRGSAREIIPNDEFGMIIKEKDEKELLVAMEDYLINYGKLNNISINIEKRIISNFSWEISVDNIEESIKALL